MGLLIIFTIAISSVVILRSDVSIKSFACVIFYILEYATVISELMSGVYTNDYITARLLMLTLAWALFLCLVRLSCIILIVIHGFDAAVRYKRYYSFVGWLFTGHAGAYHY